MAFSGSNPLNIGILLFDEVEVLDFCGPFEVFSVTGSLHNETISKVITIAENKTISTRGGMKVIPDHLICDDLSNLDVLLIPGGLGTRKLVSNETVLNWIKKLAPSLKNVITVCTGAALAGKCGLLENMVITTHHLGYEFVGQNCPNSKICKCRRYTDNDPVFTSAGISAGIDLALYYVKKQFGQHIAEETANHMEYDWKTKDPGNCTCGAECK